MGVVFKQKRQSKASFPTPGLFPVAFYPRSRLSGRCDLGLNFSFMSLIDINT
jgi:hypothetical protein